MENATQSAIQFAAETGRLDFVSALLAIIALIWAISAIPVFLFLKYRAETVARKAAEEELETLRTKVENLAIERLEGLLPTLINEYMELAQNAVSGDQADEIAHAVSETYEDDDS